MLLFLESIITDVRKIILFATLKSALSSYIPYQQAWSCRTRYIKLFQQFISLFGPQIKTTHGRKCFLREKVEGHIDVD